MLLHKATSFFIFFAQNDAIGALEHKRTNTSRPRSYNQDGFVLSYFKKVSSPKAGGQDFTHKIGLLIADAIGDIVLLLFANDLCT